MSNTILIQRGIQAAGTPNTTINVSFLGPPGLIITSKPEGAVILPINDPTSNPHAQTLSLEAGGEMKFIFGTGQPLSTVFQVYFWQDGNDEYNCPNFEIESNGDVSPYDDFFGKGENIIFQQETDYYSIQVPYKLERT